MMILLFDRGCGPWAGLRGNAEGPEQFPVMIASGLTWADPGARNAANMSRQNQFE